MGPQEEGSKRGEGEAEGAMGKGYVVFVSNAVVYPGAGVEDSTGYET